MCVPPVDNTSCAAFDEYEDVPKTLPLDFMVDDLTLVASNISGAAGVLKRGMSIDLRNWLVCFGYASEDLSVIVANLSD